MRESMGLREFIWEETATIKGHLRSGRETYYGRIFLKYMKVILMRSPDNGGYGISTSKQPRLLL